MRTLITTSMALALGLMTAVTMGQEEGGRDPAPSPRQPSTQQPIPQESAQNAAISDDRDLAEKPAANPADQSFNDHRESRSTDNTTGKASGDQLDQSNRWRYVRHDGQWWYWTPQNTWLIWSENRWVSQAEYNRMYAARQSSQPGSYRTGYRGNGNFDDGYYNRGYFNRGYYGPGSGYRGYYGPGYYGPGYGFGPGYGWGGGYYSPGVTTGAGIGGAIGGRSGANVGAAIGGAIGGW